MGYFESGCDDMSGMLEYGPKEIRAQLLAVDRFLKTVDKDIVNDVKKTGNTGFLGTWRAEVIEPWGRFFGGFDPVKYVRDASYKRAEAFRQLGLRFRENLQKKQSTGTVVTPVPIPQPIRKPLGSPQSIEMDRDSGFTPSWFSWRKVAIVGGVGVGLYFGYRWYTSPVRRLKRLAQAKQEAAVETLEPVAEAV